MQSIYKSSIEYTPTKRPTQSFEVTVVELPILMAVTRGLWRSVSHTSKTIQVVEEEASDVSEEQIIE